MKFQKTLLALSLGLLAGGAYAQDAAPASVTENLMNPLAIYPGDVVSAPVNGRSATNSAIIDADSDWLQAIDYGTTQIDLGTGGSLVAVPTGDVTWDAFSYTSADGTKQIFQFEDQTTGEKTALYEYDPLTLGLTRYTGGIKEETRQSGGQIVTSGGAITSGFENRRINSEHVIYGYQGGISESVRFVDGGTLTDTDGNTQQVTNGDVEFLPGNDNNEIRYVQQGIIANSGALRVDGTLDPAKNVYGVSARDNANVTVMTGNGIALANVSNGKLQIDGSVLNSVYVANSGTTVNPKAYKYEVAGKNILEIADLNSPNDSTKSKFYEVSAAGAILGTYTGATAGLRGSQVETGVIENTSGTFNNGQIHNTVTNKNVTYSEKIETVDQTQLKGSTVNADRTKKTDIDEVLSQTVKSKTAQSVSTGIIGANADNSNLYGLEVKKEVVANGVTTTAKTTITADSITTTGSIKANKIFLGATELSVDGLTAIVDGATGAVLTNAKTYTDAEVGKVKTETTAAIAESKQYTDTKTNAAVAEVKTIATNVTNSLNNVNNRIDDVQKTAYRGVAIALAAQQQVPNIKPGQFAVFGGVGHYESESAAALGVVGALNDRLSMSAALGFAGGSEVGGRVGVAYVFGGN